MVLAIGELWTCLQKEVSGRKGSRRRERRVEEGGRGGGWEEGSGS